MARAVCVNRLTIWHRRGGRKYGVSAFRCAILWTTPIRQELQGRNAQVPDVVRPAPATQEWLFLGSAGLDVDFATTFALGKGLGKASDNAPMAPERTAAIPSRASSSARSLSA